MFLFSTDIDGTVYDGPETARRFAGFWESLRETAHPPILAYNTGRALDDTRSLIDSTSLPSPDYIIAGVGTEMFDFTNDSPLDAWHETLSADWDFAEVEQIVRSTAHGIEMQPAVCQNPFKCSWYWSDKGEEDLVVLRDALDAAGVSAQVVYSSRRDLDILPRAANKGNAVTWLWNWLDRQTLPLVVAGDSGNDSSMFHVDGVQGILVSNAETALFESVPRSSSFLASFPCADGVIEGLTHFSRTYTPGATGSSAEDVI